jgi:Notch-like protein
MNIATAAVPNPCQTSPCQNSGICVTLMDDKGVPRGFLCKCISPQDSGVYCEERNYCNSDPCLNGGMCINAVNGYSCECTPTHKGTNCELYDICMTRPCKNQGTCTIKSSAYFECNCTKDFYGPTCEKLNPCFNVTCSGRGTCRYTPDDYFCLCEHNYLGKNCEMCKPQFTGRNCDQCITGFTGKNCDVLLNFCAPNPCVNGFCLKNGFDYNCVCSEGWRGRNCSEKNCLLNSCLNGGVCTLGYNNQTDQIDYRCSCPPGMFGDQCENSSTRFFYYLLLFL